MQKVYPNTIVIKKSIVGAAIIAACCIVLLILINLFHSSRRNNAIQSNNDVHLQFVPNQADLSWFQHQTIKTGAHPVQSGDLTQPKSVTSNAVTYQESPPAQTLQQDVVKAMSAPITSNELTEVKQSFSSSTSLPPDLQNSQISSTTDPNMQNEKNAFMQNHANALDSDYLGSTLKDPISPFVVQAGTMIPGVLITGINSGLPGQITGQVRSNVYDSISGKHILIPQGSKLTGLYDSQIAYGQDRVLVVWKRIIFPNGQSINLQGMPGVDMSGYAGFNDQVNNHYGKIFGSVILMSMLSAGAQLSQPQNSSNPWQAPTVGQTMAQSLGTNISNTGTMMTTKNLDIQPNLKIRPGYEFNISVTKDIVFPSAYEG